MPIPEDRDEVGTGPEFWREDGSPEEYLGLGPALKEEEMNFGGGGAKTTKIHSNHISK